MKADVEQARRNLPLPRLMEQHGDMVPAGRSVRCPFCADPGKKKSASLQEKDGRWWFKCFSSSCRSATDKEKGSWDEVGYLAWKTGLGRKEAFIAFLKEAGVWKEVGSGKSRVRSEQEGEDTSPRPSPRERGEGEDGEEANLPGVPGCSSGEAAAPAVTPGGAEAAGGETPPPELEGGFESADLRAGLGIEVRAARPDVLRSVLALRDFYAGLTLSEKDEELIWRKRGLPHSACVAFGFKSSPRSNEKLLRGLSPKYTEDELVSAGLWKRDGEECRPQPQLCGWGMMGKDEWGWAHPILIPYFDEEGQVIALRPHKGNVPGERPRLFVATDCHAEAAPARAEGDGSTRVITEGEFKACAVYWVFGGKAGAAALPGISQAKNFLVMQELKSWLATGRRPERVVVAFDNEEKGDSRLPGFKADKRKRFDAEIWARYLAIVLKRECGEATVARLPDEWRDAKGKADWDGRLGAVMNAA